MDLSGSEDTLINSIHMSLAVEKGSWWLNPDFGSELPKLRREKANEATARLVKSYVLAALKWMVAAGKLTSVTVTTEVVKSRINYLVVALAANSAELKYSNFVEVA